MPKPFRNRLSSGNNSMPARRRRKKRGKHFEYADTELNSDYLESKMKHVCLLANTDEAKKSPCPRFADNNKCIKI
jgi:hypothetical protein